MRRIAGVAAVFAVCAWVGVRAEARIGTAPVKPLRAVAALNSVSVLYGDPVTAQVEVDYDPRTVSPATIRVRPSFVPYVVSSPPVVESRDAGAVRFRYSLLCVTDGCLPTRGARVLHLEPVTVTGLAGTRTLTATAAWPTLRIYSRLSPSDLTRIRFRRPISPPSPAYRLAPGPLAAGLIGAAALFTLAAMILALAALTGRVRRARATSLPPLELAIAYVRDSARRPEPDRRRALGFLADAVDDRGDSTLAAAASDTAWSKSPPTPAAAEKLADRAGGLDGGTE